MIQYACYGVPGCQLLSTVSLEIANVEQSGQRYHVPEVASTTLPVQGDLLVG
ncbi:hypothetical protein IV500_16880 [Paeniglutamicibacter antarcticus]|uniref:Uncharacterized protein n=1 Tax=Arthrobacter terrae TaxID=2935737 RepID=A0A931CTB3_9MICC|nr:hypothetical protein [Arthrobacter terrae]MBG0741049.1 hypothetical protein [Arthrobacter terrae]